MPPLGRAAAYAQGGSPFDTGFTALQNLFAGTVAKVASPIAIVVGGYQFAHGEPGAKRALNGVAAGTGIAVLAANFDANFPAAAMARRLVRVNASASRVLPAVLTLFPLDDFADAPLTVMEVHRNRSPNPSVNSKRPWTRQRAAR